MHYQFLSEDDHDLEDSHEDNHSDDGEEEKREEVSLTKRVLKIGMGFEKCC